MQYFNLIVFSLFSIAVFSQSDSITLPIDSNIIEFEKKALMFVKNMPHFEECKGENNMERNKCTRQLINNYISQNFVIPEKAIKKKIAGTSYVSFIVNKKGEVSNIEVIKSAHKILNAACIKAVQAIPNLIPGKQLGKEVPIMYTVPIKVSY
jgi:protein TonB